MHNELTRIDIEKMKEELDYRRITLRPQLLEEVKTARSFGDLSENFEYKAAKREKNKNESRIRYLENMIKTARVIEDRSAPDAVGLYDKVTVFPGEPRLRLLRPGPVHPERRGRRLRRPEPVLKNNIRIFQAHLCGDVRQLM